MRAAEKQILNKGGEGEIDDAFEEIVQQFFPLHAVSACPVFETFDDGQQLLLARPFDQTLLQLLDQLVALVHEVVDVGGGEELEFVLFLEIQIYCAQSHVVRLGLLQLLLQTLDIGFLPFARLPSRLPIFLEPSLP